MGKRKGRPHKPGRRTASGRPVPTVSIVKGSAWAEARKATFGTNAADPLGRAYVAGLLGDGDEAKARLMLGRKVAWTYRMVYDRPYTCPLDQTVRGGGEEPEWAYEREAWLAETMRRVNLSGTGPFFDQLVDQHNLHPDSGPAWLDRLIVEALANRQRALSGKPLLPFERRDWIVLRAAIMGLDALLANPVRIAPVEPRIRAA